MAGNECGCVVRPRAKNVRGGTPLKRKKKIHKKKGEKGGGAGAGAGAGKNSAGASRIAGAAAGIPKPENGRISELIGNEGGAGREECSRSPKPEKGRISDLIGNDVRGNKGWAWDEGGAGREECSRSPKPEKGRISDLIGNDVHGNKGNPRKGYRKRRRSAKKPEALAVPAPEGGLGHNFLGSSQALRSGIEERIKGAASQYRNAWKALLALRGPGVWEEKLRVLRQEDIRGMNERSLNDDEKEEERRARILAGLSPDEDEVDEFGDVVEPTRLFNLETGEGTRTLSWLWYTGASADTTATGKVHDVMDVMDIVAVEVDLEEDVAYGEYDGEEGEPDDDLLD
ncbi:hypothetical protein B0H12DRAFT_1072590 [Mycena haematopus]|nr:hypothetical protein B0H12DRAFT_1072590 [Mycena haematopus]